MAIGSYELLLFAFLIFVGYLLIMRWVYLDAKANDLNPWLWMVIMFLTFGNFLGLIGYAIVRSLKGKKMNEVICENCNSAIPTSSVYCPDCGIKNNSQKTVQVKRPSMSLLIAGIIMTLSMIILITGSLFFTRASGGNRTSMSSHQRYNAEEHSFEGFERISEYYFTIENESDALVYSTSLAKGEISYQLYDFKNNFIHSLDENTVDTLRNFRPGEKYKIVVDPKKATGSFSFKVINEKIEN